MIWSAITSNQQFLLYDEHFAHTIVIMSSLQALSYLLKSMTLYPLGKHNDILSISKAQVALAFFFSALAFILLLLRYGYEMKFFYDQRNELKEYDDEVFVNAAKAMNQQILTLAIIFVLITVVNAATLGTVFQFYIKLDKFKIDAQNAIASPSAVSINPVSSGMVIGTAPAYRVGH